MKTFSTNCYTSSARAIEAVKGTDLHIEHTRGLSVVMGFNNINEAQAFVNQYDESDILDIWGVSLVKRRLGQKIWDKCSCVSDEWHEDFKDCGKYVDDATEWAVGVIFADGERPTLKDCETSAELAQAIINCPALLDGSVYTYNADPALVEQMGEEELKALADDITKDGALEILTDTADEWADLMRKLNISDADRVLVNRASGIAVALNGEWDE